MIFISCHSHGNEILIIKKFFLHIFLSPPDTTRSNGNALKEFCEENELVEGV